MENWLGSHGMKILPLLIFVYFVRDYKVEFWQSEILVQNNGLRIITFVLF